MRDIKLYLQIYTNDVNDAHFVKYLLSNTMLHPVASIQSQSHY